MSPQFGRRRLLDPLGEQAVYDRSRRRARIIGRIIVGFCAVIVMVGAGGVLIVQHILGNVKHGPALKTLIDPKTRPVKETAPPNAKGGGTAQNILILGVD
ncbi:MAG: hypothetical protein ACRDV3_04370, partial [Acidothermaceae bacterium]